MEWLTRRLFGPSLSLREVVGRRIRAPLGCRDWVESVHSLCELLSPDAGLGPVELARALTEREHIASTVLPNGVAIPRARVRGVPGVMAALGIAPAGIDLGVDAPVRIVLALICPDFDRESFVRALTRATLALDDVRLLRALLQATSAEAARETLTFWKSPNTEGEA